MRPSRGKQSEREFFVGRYGRLLVELVDDRPTVSEHSGGGMVRILYLEDDDSVLADGAAEIAAQHLAELGVVVQGQGGAVDADKPTAIAHEVDQGASLRVRKRQVSVGHHHDTVEPGQVFGVDDREIEARGIL